VRVVEFLSENKSPLINKVLYRKSANMVKLNMALYSGSDRPENSSESMMHPSKVQSSVFVCRLPCVSDLT